MTDIQRLRPACDFCGNDFVLGMGIAKFRIDGQNFVVHSFAYNHNLGRGHEDERVDCKQGIIDRESGTLSKFLKNVFANKNMGQLDNG